MAIVAFAGVTAIETSVAAVTANDVDPEMLPSCAAIVVDPTPAAVVNPVDPKALLIEAVAGVDEVQTTCEVRSCVELSE